MTMKTVQSIAATTQIISKTLMQQNTCYCAVHDNNK